MYNKTLPQIFAFFLCCIVVNGAFQLNFIDCDRKHNKKVNTAIFRNILSPGKKFILSLLAYNTHPILCFIFGVKKVRIIRETLRYPSSVAMPLCATAERLCASTYFIASTGRLAAGECG